LHQVGDCDGKPSYTLRVYDHRGFRCAYVGSRSELRDLADTLGQRPHEFTPKSADQATTEMIACLLQVRESSPTPTSAIINSLLQLAEDIGVCFDLTADLRRLNRHSDEAIALRHMHEPYGATA
jgi:hypothetical protein